MHKTYLIIGALLGALAVVLGAFGAHGLHKIATPEMIETYQTGVRYQFYHVFALLAVGILYHNFQDKLMSLSGLFFIVGILLFSGSLYLITFMQASGNTIPTGLGFITPLGGLFLIATWLLMLVSLSKKRVA